MNDLELSLRDSMVRAAERAPHTPSTLAYQVETLYRRRWQHRRTLIAAVAVIVAGIAAGVPSLGPATTAVQRATAVEPIEQVWPQAIKKVPASAVKGNLIAKLDDHTLLLETWSQTKQLDYLYTYDIDTDATHEIVDVTRQGSHKFPPGYVVGDGHIVWWYVTQERLELVTAPLTGGEQRVFATLDRRDMTGAGDMIDELAVVAGKVVFSLEKGGVYTVHLAGGTVEPVPQADGMHLLRWPWVGTSNRYSDPRTDVLFKDMLNVKTGERSTAVVHPGDQYVKCAVTRCTGVKADGQPFSRLRDGSQETDLPTGAVSLTPQLMDRFHVEDNIVLRDLSTGAEADLGMPAGQATYRFYPTRSQHRSLLAYQVKDEVVLVDLTKIP
jgi:hypothetical protein